MAASCLLVVSRSIIRGFAVEAPANKTAGEKTANNVPNGIQAQLFKLGPLARRDETGFRGPNPARLG